MSKPYIGGVIGGSTGTTSGVFSPGGLSNPGDVPSLELNFDGQTSSGTGDNHWDSVTLLLDGSSTTNDLSPANQDTSITNNGSLASVAGPTGYGTVSALSFNGTTQYLKTSYYNASLYNQDFTIEGWFNIASSATGAAQTFFSHRATSADSTGVTPYILSSGSRYGLVVGDNNGFPVNVSEASGSGTVATGWHHIAVTRSGNDYTLFVDGVSILTSNTSATVAVSGDFTVASGTSGTVAQYLDCEVVDFRVTEGVARYTADFTPPSTQLPTTKGATTLNKLATDIISCTRSTTATFLGSNGLIQTAAVNTPRVEFDASGNPLGLLVEEARTNLLTQSADLTHSDWSALNSLAVTGGQADPAGGTQAALIEDNSNTLFSYFRQDVSGVAANATYTASIFVKKTASAASEVLLRTRDLALTGAANVDCRLNTATGEINGSSGIAVQDYNGWWRISATATMSSSPGNIIFSVYPALSSSFNGANDPVAQTTVGTHIVYGPQIEVGEGATSYIPTDATTLQRTADDITLATSNFGYNTAANTALVDFTLRESNLAFNGIYRFDDGSNSNNDAIYYDVAAAKLIRQVKDSNTATPYDVETALSPPFSRVIAARNDGTAARDAIDGTLGSLQTVVAPVTLRTTLYLGRTTTNYMTGHIRRFTYFPRAVSDASLVAYTGTNRPTDGEYLPTRKWGGILGSGDLSTSTSVPGIATLAEHYQSKL